MKYTKLTDKSGNIYITDLPYKSRTAALLFDPITVQKSKTSFGGELKDHSGTFIYDKARVGYRAKQESDEIFQNVGNYILQFKDDSQRLNLFKNALETRITDAKTRVSDYNIEQLSEFLPWVMSCQFLFEPLRSYMFCLANGISHENANEVKNRIPGEMINNEVNKAIRKAVLENNSLIEEAKNIYSLNHIGYIIKGFRKALQLSESFKNFVEKAWEKMTEGAKKAYRAFTENSVVKAIGDLFDFNEIQGKYVPEKDPEYEEKPAEVAGAMKFFDELATEIFKELRVYGEVVVNMNYIRVTGIRKIIDGKLLYYYLERPNLLFGIENSFLSIYNLQENGNIVSIPPSSFTIEYLRKLVQGEVVGLGGRMFKSIKDDITQTKEDKEGFNKFANKFLQWNNTIPTVSKNELSKFKKDTMIKKEVMNKKDAERARKAYQEEEDFQINKELLALMKQQNQPKRNNEKMANQTYGIKPTGADTPSGVDNDKPMPISAAEKRERTRERQEELKQLKNSNIEQYYDAVTKNYLASLKRKQIQKMKEEGSENRIAEKIEELGEEEQEEIKLDIEALTQAELLALTPNDSFMLRSKAKK